MTLEMMKGRLLIPKQAAKRKTKIQIERMTRKEAKLKGVKSQRRTKAKEIAKMGASNVY